LFYPLYVTVIDFIYNQKASQHELFLQLHSFIIEYEGLRADIKYKIPFYSKSKPICYINPLKSGGVEVVFWNALKMTESLPLLDLKKRKWMAGIAYENIEDVNFEVFDSIMKEGIACDGPLNIKKSHS
jgi:hypothetical protein